MGLLFAVLNFLFFRIMSAAMFDAPLTILASAIIAVITQFVVAYGGLIGFAWSEELDERGHPNISLGKLFLAFFATSAAASLFAYLIALGFSQSLYEDLNRWGYREEFYETDMFWFVVMISIPVFVQFAQFYLQMKSKL